MSAGRSVVGDDDPAHRVLGSRDAGRSSRPPRWGPVLLVMAGGALGTLARWGVGHWHRGGHGLPLVTTVVNLLGAYLLGLLLEVLLRTHPDQGRPRDARLFFGTGFLGAFTTMGTLAVESLGFVQQGRPLVGLGYLVLSSSLGLLLAWLGIVTGAQWAPGRQVGR